jgi:manganese-dependent inorganic pyrophosphatase
LIVGNPEKILAGNVGVGAMKPDVMIEYIKDGDIAILGNREDAQEAALKQRVSCLVITGNLYPSKEIVDLAERQQSVIILTPYDTFAAAKLINLGVPAEEIMEKEFLTVDQEALFSEVTDDMLNSEHRLALVAGSDNHLLGIITRQDLVNPVRRKAILVDHNEMSQSVSGIEEAQILEIIDHHRLGDIQTGEPILVINEPLGATSTIIFKMFKEKRKIIPKEIAGIMLAAILSDTVLMKSPTTTEEDKSAISELAELAGVNALDFGVEMYRYASNIDSASAKDLIFGDFKLYEFNEMRLGIGQLETIDSKSALKRKEEILNVMNQVLIDKDYDGLILMITDILREGTELLVVGKTKIVEKAFGKKLSGSGMFLPGVISRKKQVAPPLARVLRAK